ncbi:MAG: methyltransferase, TIGR04325 family [Variovorax sp.]|nr:methyltransferase, TIGR04325 family [Variovorax sp.]
MSLYGVIHSARGIVDWPFVRPSRLKWERKRFLSPRSNGAYFGVYESFASARTALPASPGFNHEAIAREYIETRTERAFEYDYPVMLWLEKAFRAGAKSVLDIGGSVGVHYYAYRPYLDMPADLSWDIVEVPIIASFGRELAAERGALPFSFTSDLNEAIGAGRHDVWISAGAIQYFEDAHPAKLLSHCAQRPAHLLLNKLPLHDGDDFVTTQNLGYGAFSPVHVYNRTRFIRSIQELGYTPLDTWDVHERLMYVPGHHECSFDKFTGVYFLDRTKGQSQ